MDYNIKNFYPTPSEVIYKMLNRVNFKDIKSVLEPSAGKGAIVKAIIDMGYKVSIDTIEQVGEFQTILKSIKVGDNRYIPVVASDFLTFQTLKRYDLIIMNPPFDNGEKHLLKAIELMQAGGRIICLLNSETLNNAYSNSRKDLLQKLQEYNAEIIDLGQAFKYAERKTDVNISMVDITITKKKYKSFIFENLKQAEEMQSKVFECKDIVISEPIQNLIEHYKNEVVAGIKLIDECNAFSALFNEKAKSAIDTTFSLSLNITNVNDYIELVRLKYWEKLLDTPKFTEKMTQTMRADFHRNLQQARYIEFNYSNIYQLAINSIKGAEISIKQELIELFDKITFKHNYSSYSNKIHLYNGWKTNKAYKVDKKFILPCFYAHQYSTIYTNKISVAELVHSVEQALAWLDYNMNNAMAWADVYSFIEKRIEADDFKKIETNYLIIDLHKKGTVHFTIKDEMILKRFNLLASQHKNWLPPSYAKKQYNDLTEEEKEIIDSYQGKKEYEEVCNNPKQYFFQNQLALQ